MLRKESGERERDAVIRKEHGEQTLDFGASADDANSKALSVMSGEKPEKAHKNSKSVTSGIDAFKRNNDSKKKSRDNSSRRFDDQQTNFRKNSKVKIK